jgi:hypothetical protein
MIPELDAMLRTLMVREIPLAADDQVSFRPPDDDWRTEVSNMQQLALNLYLVDLRENRKLRSNERVRVGEEFGQVIYQQAPARVDCHYLITAWSPVQPGPALEPTVDEHRLLYQAMAVLMNNLPLNPIRIYGAGDPILGTLPELFTRDLPTQVLPVEGFIKQPEFWGTMGQDHRWRPAIYLIVTLPLALIVPPAGPMVTSPVARLDRTDRPGSPDQLFFVGGRVLDATQTPSVPLEDAWVQLSDANGRRLAASRTNPQGQFIFQVSEPGEYQLEWRAEGRPVPPPRDVIVPSATGEYDLVFV